MKRPCFSKTCNYSIMSFNDPCPYVHFGILLAFSSRRSDYFCSGIARDQRSSVTKVIVVSSSSHLAFFLPSLLILLPCTASFAPTFPVLEVHSSSTSSYTAFPHSSDDGNFGGYLPGIARRCCIVSTFRRFSPLSQKNHLPFSYLQEAWKSSRRLSFSDFVGV